MYLGFNISFLKERHRAWSHIRIGWCWWACGDYRKVFLTIHERVEFWRAQSHEERQGWSDPQAPQAGLLHTSTSPILIVLVSSKTWDPGSISHRCFILKFFLLVTADADGWLSQAKGETQTDQSFSPLKCQGTKRVQWTNWLLITHCVRLESEDRINPQGGLPNSGKRELKRKGEGDGERERCMMPV